MIVLGSWFFSLVLNIPQFFRVTYIKDNIYCLYSEQWIGRANLLGWLSYTFISSALMIGLYSRVVHTLWFKRHDHNVQSCQRQVISTFQVASCSQALNETVHLNSFQKNENLSIERPLNASRPQSSCTLGTECEKRDQRQGEGITHRASYLLMCFLVCFRSLCLACLSSFISKLPGLFVCVLRTLPALQLNTLQ